MLFTPFKKLYSWSKKQVCYALHRDGYYAKSVGDLTKGINLQRAVNDLTI
jgi:hypothetical protein